MTPPPRCEHLRTRRRDLPCPHPDCEDGIDEDYLIAEGLGKVIGYRRGQDGIEVIWVKFCPRCQDAQDEVGKTLWCTVCPRSKNPVGRSAPMYSAGSYCTNDCTGYYLDPKPTSLWSGETRLEFGYGGVMTEPCTCPSEDAYDCDAGDRQDPSDSPE